MPNENSRRPVVGETVCFRKSASTGKSEDLINATQRELDELTIVDDYINGLVWASDTPHDVRGLVAANLRGFFSQLRGRGLVA